MKNKKRSSLSLVFGVFALFAASTSHAQDKIGNAGDPYAIEFKQIALDVTSFLIAHPIPLVDPTALMAMIAKTQLSSQDSLSLNGADVGAINYPDATTPRIVISRKDWDGMKASTYKKDFLVLHEFLDLLGINDSNYNVSSAMDQAHVCSRSPGIRGAIEDFFKISCDRILGSDLPKVTGLEFYGTDGEFFDHFGVKPVRTSPGIAPLLASDFDGLINLGGTFNVTINADELPDGLLQKAHFDMIEIAFTQKVKTLQAGLFANLKSDSGIYLNLQAPGFDTIENGAFAGSNFSQFEIRGPIDQLAPDALKNFTSSNIVFSASNGTLPMNLASILPVGATQEPVQIENIDAISANAFSGFHSTSVLRLYSELNAKDLARKDLFAGIQANILYVSDLNLDKFDAHNFATNAKWKELHLQAYYKDLPMSAFDNWLSNPTALNRQAAIWNGVGKSLIKLGLHCTKANDVSQDVGEVICTHP